MTEQTQSFHAVEQPENVAVGAAAIVNEALQEAAQHEARSLQEAEERAAAQATAEAEETARVRAATDEHRLALLVASQSLGNVLGAVAEISALLTWQPDRTVDADQIAIRAAGFLASFRSHLVAIAAVGPARPSQGQGREPHDYLPERYGTALDALRELHRQIGAQIALIETDVANTPAIVAMERVVAERAVFANIACQGLGIVLAETGMTR